MLNLKTKTNFAFNLKLASFISEIFDVLSTTNCYGKTHKSWIMLKVIRKHLKFKHWTNLFYLPMDFVFKNSICDYKVITTIASYNYLFGGGQLSNKNVLKEFY